MSNLNVLDKVDWKLVLEKTIWFNLRDAGARGAPSQISQDEMVQQARVQFYLTMHLKLKIYLKNSICGGNAYNAIRNSILLCSENLGVPIWISDNLF